MKLPFQYIVLIGFVYLTISCENRDVNEGERFRPRELHDNYSNSHFTKVTVDGVEYLMMERDNNNPHEGFGFMAFRANKLIEKHDTAIAYLKTINDFQIRIYAKLYKISLEQAKAENRFILEQNILEQSELLSLEQNELKSGDGPLDSLSNKDQQ